MPIDRRSFGGYGVALRNFFIHGVDLVARRRFELSDKRLYTEVIGKGILETDSVCIIGAKETVNEFDLLIRSDELAAQLWSDVSQVYQIEDLNDRVTPVNYAAILKNFSKDPPTATLISFAEDWELGFKNGRWQLECMLPPETLAQLAGDLIANKTRDIELQINWFGALVRDENAPPVVPTVWGLYKLSLGMSPEPLRGWVTSARWGISALSSIKQQESM